MIISPPLHITTATGETVTAQAFPGRVCIETDDGAEAVPAYLSITEARRFWRQLGAAIQLAERWHAVVSDALDRRVVG